jgi:hypothetical protein
MRRLLVRRGLLEWDELTQVLLRLVGRSVRRARDEVILKSTTSSGGLLL